MKNTLEVNTLEANKMPYARVAMRFWNEPPPKESDRIYFVLTLESHHLADPKVEPGVLIILGKLINPNKKDITISTIQRQFDEHSSNAHKRCEICQTSATFDLDHPNEMHLAIIKKREGCFTLGEAKSECFPLLVDCIEHESNRPIFKGEYNKTLTFAPHPYRLPVATKRGSNRRCRHGYR